MLSSSKSPSDFGQSVTFTAKVAGLSPTGTVAFFDSGAQIGMGTLAAGIASFTRLRSLRAAIRFRRNTVAIPTMPQAPRRHWRRPLMSRPKHRAARDENYVTPMIAHISGQAIAGAIEGAIDTGFSGGPPGLTPSGGGFIFEIPLGPPAAVIGSGGNRTTTSSGAGTGNFANGKPNGSGTDAGSLANGRQGGNGAPPGTRLIDLPVIPLPPGSGVPPIGETRFSPDEVMLQFASAVTSAANSLIAQRFGLTLLSQQTIGIFGTHYLHFAIANGRSVREVIPVIEAAGTQCCGAAPLQLCPDPRSKQSQCRSGRSGTIHRKKIPPGRGPSHQQDCQC